MCVLFEGSKEDDVIVEVSYYEMKVDLFIAVHVICISEEIDTLYTSTLLGGYILYLINHTHNTKMLQIHKYICYVVMLHR